jgi:hypothetical protein
MRGACESNMDREQVIRESKWMNAMRLKKCELDLWRIGIGTIYGNKACFPDARRKFGDLIT